MKNTEQSVYEMLNPPKKKAAVAVVDSNMNTYYRAKRHFPTKRKWKH